MGATPAADPAYRDMSNGKLMVSGALAGTAWMIGEDLAFTAHHCLPLGATEAEMRFGEGRWTVRVLDRDVDLDVALLLITAPTVGLPPALPLSERPDIHSHPVLRCYA